MATQSDQSSVYGFPAPQGSDYISEGDDAITKLGNAVAYRLGVAFADLKRLLGADLPDNTDLDTLRDTARWIVFSTRNHPNRPAPEFGRLEVFRYGSSSQTQVWTSADLGSTTYKRYGGSTGWTPWERIDAAGVLAAAEGYADTITAGTPTPGAHKTVPLALTVGGGAATFTMTTGAARLPISYAAPVTRFKVHVRNFNPRWPNVYAGAVSLTGLWVGEHDGAGKFVGTPTRVAVAASTPSDGTEWTSEWVTYPLDPGKKYLLAYGWTATAATQTVVGGGWTTPAPADATSSNAALTRRGTMPLDLWLEAETPASTPVIAALGDSLSAGVGATLPVYDSVISQYARARGALPVHYAMSGTDAGAWTSPSDHKWTRWDGYGLARPDAVLVSMGNNDAFTGSSLAKLQSDYTTLVSLAKTKLSPNLYATTLLPREGVTGAPEDTRRAFNAWLTGTTGRRLARDVVNIVPVVSTDDETLIDALDADGIHLKTAGYTAVKDALPSTLLPVGVGATLMRAPDAATARAAIGAAAQQETGIRDITATIPGLDATNSGYVRIWRQGSAVHLAVYNLKMAAAYNNTAAFTLPDGFRPALECYGISATYWSAQTGDDYRILGSGALLPQGLDAGESLTLNASYPTRDTFPTTYPGTPA